MRAVVQRVSSANVEAGGQAVGAIGRGLVALVGVGHHDAPADMEWMAQKLLNLRIFADESGKMNLNVQDVRGGLLLVSQFTLYASTQRGNRPSFVNAAQPANASAMFDSFVGHLRSQYAGPVETGQFGAHMRVSLLNDGPVTLILDSQNRTLF